MKQITVIRKIMRARGYLVLWQAKWHTQWTVGQVIPYAGFECFNLGKPLLVVAKTSKTDFLAQQRLSKKIDPGHWKRISPTRKVAIAVKKASPTFWKVKLTRRKFL